MLAVDGLWCAFTIQQIHYVQIAVSFQRNAVLLQFFAQFQSPYITI
jgi:hypothetical protein